MGNKVPLNECKEKLRIELTSLRGLIVTGIYLKTYKNLYSLPVMFSDGMCVYVCVCTCDYLYTEKVLKTNVLQLEYDTNLYTWNIFHL